jgi:tryptophan synthase alpha chain
MSRIKEEIEKINNRNEKALSIFLTGGYPEVEGFVDFALQVLDAGADMLEIGIPFSDPLADGAVIQQSSQLALGNGVNLKRVLQLTAEIKINTNKPVILMGYANPIFHYGIERFFKDANEAGADGVIVPDIPIDEFESFFPKDRNEIDTILLTTPQSGENRIKQIDSESSGFVYCVSVSGTTGVRDSFSEEDINSLMETRKIIKKNKMLVGFGISTQENIKQVSPYCDGVIVGSALIKSLRDSGIKDTLKLVKNLKNGCKS